MNNTDIDNILKSNPNAPTNDQYALDMAQKLFPNKDKRIEGALEFKFSEKTYTLASNEQENVEWCGESTVGLLETVLLSNLISKDAKKEIRNMISNSMPTLEKEKTIGHFKFKWTENSPDSLDNVTEDNIDATAVILNESWERYTNDFRQPKSNLIDSLRIIDVEVYSNPRLHGSTMSHSNTIFLNSSTVVMDACRRQTTSAHELFHRVQYSYGYVTGTPNQAWWVEALGAWSQEYSYHAINDYVTRVNWGLAKPNLKLLNRSYDACHYWKYFGEQLMKRNLEVTSEQQALREFLEEFATNGFDAKAASEAITLKRISMNFDRFFQDWSKANYIKDLDNPNDRYEYEKDEEITTSCSRIYGPYKHVEPIVDKVIDSNSFSWISQQMEVDQYGTDYLHFEIRTGVTDITFRFEANVWGGKGKFSTHFILIKNNRREKIYNNVNGENRTWNLNFSSGQYDRCVLIVNGLSSGGQYEVSINTKIGGVWKDNFNFVWTLFEFDDTVEGNVLTTSCGSYSVVGNIVNKSDIVLNASGSCSQFKYKGSIVDYKTISGSWTNNLGGNGDWLLERSDTVEAMRTLESEELELADDPATMRG